MLRGESYQDLYTPELSLIVHSSCLIPSLGISLESCWLLISVRMSMSME